MGKNEGLTTLYLRGLPATLVRETKALAAKRGITLAALAAEAFARVTAEEPAERTPSDLDADIAWYKANKRKLLSRYRGQYIAISGGKVIDHGREFDPLARRVFARVGPRAVFMPRCEPGERVVNVGSPRVVRS